MVFLCMLYEMWWGVVIAIQRKARILYFSIESLVTLARYIILLLTIERKKYAIYYYYYPLHSNNPETGSVWSNSYTINTKFKEV